MKDVSNAARLTVERENAIGIKTRLFGEWEHNRFQIPAVTVTPSTSDNPEWQVFYDLESVALPNRPTTGSAKARLDNSYVRAQFGSKDYPDTARFYPSDSTDPYKYFSHTQSSSLIRNAAGNFNFASPITLTVTYPVAAPSNKIVLGFETSYSHPTNFLIQYSPNGTTWLNVANTPEIQSDGTVVLWRQAGGDWIPVPDYDDAVMVKAVRVTVFEMADPFVHLDVLQLGARLENDLTEFLIEWESHFEVSDRSFIAPLGKASANTATLTLVNHDLRFNTDNVNSLYYNMIEKKVKLYLDVGIDSSPQGGGVEWVREFTMWADSWGGQEQSTVTVELKDSSVFLQETSMPKIFLEDNTVGAIAWQVMDRLGYTNYEYSRVATDTGQVIPYYWPESDVTVWEEFARLAEATQTAIYFDEFDVMQIKTRKAMFKLDNTIEWQFDATANGEKLPDVIELDVNRDMETNKVNVTYSPANFSDFNNGLPMMETVWESDEDVIYLHSTPMKADLTPNSPYLLIDANDAITWPYESLVNIRGEIMRYKGKEYIYYVQGGGTASTFVTTQEEKDKVDNELSSPDWSWKNSFTGRFRLTERGLMGTPASDHRIRQGNYTSVVTNYGNSVFQPTTTGAIYRSEGFPATSYLQGRSDTDDVLTYTLTKSDTSVLALKSVMYGTRMRFPKEGWNVGGLFFAGDWGDAGYYLEISPTSHVNDIEGRTWRHELSLQVMPGNAPHQSVISDNYDRETGEPEGYKGFGWAIAIGQWFTVDVKWTYLDSSSAYVMAFIDGVFAGDWFIGRNRNANIAPPPNEGRFGMFVRGNCVVDYDYLYAIGYDWTEDPFDADASRFLDLVNGGFTSGYIERDWRYDFQYISPWYGGNYFPQNINRAKYVFDEFGPQVHEIREFDVQFEDEKIPVSHSQAFFTNRSQLACLSYEANAFGARFLIANTHRRGAYLKGEDDFTKIGESVNHSFSVYGRLLYQEDERVLGKTDEESIRRSGIMQTDFQSRYIQTEAAANDLGQWVVDLWGSGVEEVTVSVFGNPFMQLGDLVSMNYPIKGIHAATHKYIIVSIDNSFSAGLATELILRRVRI